MTGFLQALSLDGFRPGKAPAGSSAAELFDVKELAGVAAAAEAAGVDLLTLGDPLAASAGAGIGLSAAETLAFLARKTRRIGLLPATSSHYTEPFHAAKAIATLDFISGGRAGVLVDYGQSAGADAHYPELAPAPPEVRVDQAGEFTEVLRKLWDSWEDGAEIRDRVSGRYVDAAKVHSINHQGSHFTVKGPLITPRPPQGQPVVALRLDPGLHGEPGWSGLLALAAGQADVVLLSGSGPVDPAQAGAVATELREAAGNRSRLQVLVRIEVDGPAAVGAAAAVAAADRLRTDGLVDGVEFTLAGPWAAPEAQELLDLVRVSAAAASGEPNTPEGSTLRSRLGLDRPLSRYAAAAVGTATAG